MRWWAVLLLALVLTAGGVAVDVLRSGTLGVVFLAAYPGGCVLAAVLAQRRDIFVPMVQPPLLLAVSVPVAIAATGTLPASGGMVSTALAIGAPLINGFPAMAATTIVCALIGFVRMRVQRWRPAEVEERREPTRSGPAGAPARDREPARPARPRDDRARDDRPRKDRPREDRPRETRSREDEARDDRAREQLERDRRDRDRREQDERERRRAQERARAERDREMAERDREKRERREQELAERERARRDRPAKKRPKKRDEDHADDRGRPEGDRERLARAEVPPGPTPRRSPLKGAGRDEAPAREKVPPPRDVPPRDKPVRDQPPTRDARSREERMREERLREERGGPRPPGVHPVRERPPERPPR
ncbi:hypothetical protein GCM10023201_00560 [Actinomycetospora corticicola]